MHETPNRMLEFLTAPPRPEGDACRSNRRRRSTVRVELAWADANGWRTVRATLRDISRGGAALVARECPPLTRSARLRVIEGEETPFIEAEVLGVEPDGPSRHRVRMRFAEPCPSFLLRLAVLGTPQSDDDVPAVRPGWLTVAPGTAG